MARYADKCTNIDRESLIGAVLLASRKSRSAAMLYTVALYPENLKESCFV